VYKPELIDGLYCSLTCKNLDIKLIIRQESVILDKKHFIDQTSSLSKKSTVHLQHCSKKLENRISKRKQLLKTSCPENFVIENFDLERLQQIFNKQLIKKKKFLLNKDVWLR